MRYSYNSVEHIKVLKTKLTSYFYLLNISTI